MVFHQLANLLLASVLLTTLVPIKQSDGKKLAMGPTTTPVPTRCQNTKPDSTCALLAALHCQASCHRCHITGASPCRDQNPQDCPKLVKECPSVCNDKCWPASTTTIANNSSAATTLPPDPLPSCPTDCPICHNHCVLKRPYCTEPNCTLVSENNETLQVCSLGCRQGYCPIIDYRSISVKFYGDPDPCKKCDGQSRCENSGTCKSLPDNVPQDEKFVCECPPPFYGKYCGRWGKTGNQFVLSRVGKNCKNSIRKESLCRESAKLLNDSQYAISNDAGKDLPYGCISDKTNNDNHYVFWNPNGLIRSADPKVREICSITENPLEGLDCINDDAKSNKSESEIESRIRESEDSCQVKPHSKPWVVRLTVNDQFVCGGTLIGKKTVVTAAHCVYREYIDVTKVILGDHHRTGTDCYDKNEKEQCIGVKILEVHKKFNSLAPAEGYDIALLGLNETVALNQRVQIAQLPEPDAPCPNGMNLVISGWGTYVEWGPSVPDLNYSPIMFGAPDHKFLWAVKHKCVDKEHCTKHYKRDNITIQFSDKILCVVGPRTGAINGPFKGDSGGPLTYTKNGKTTLYGVASFVLTVKDRPKLTTKLSLTDESGYTRVADPDIRKWINDSMQKTEKD